jgi:hypothetical protein
LDCFLTISVNFDVLNTVGLVSQNAAKRTKKRYLMNGNYKLNLK